MYVELNIITNGRTDEATRVTWHFQKSREWHRNQSYKV